MFTDWLNRVFAVSLSCLIVFSSACASGSGKRVETIPVKYTSASGTTPTERIVVLQVKGKGLSPDERNYFRTAIVEVLQAGYVVLSGEEVDKKVKEIYEKESREALECDAEKCLQEIGIEFNAELIAKCTVVKMKSQEGYMLTLNINNVFDNKNILAQSKKCPDCDQFDVVSRLKEITAEAPNVKPAELPKSVVAGGEGEGGGSTSWWKYVLGALVLGGLAVVVPGSAGSSGTDSGTTPTDGGGDGGSGGGDLTVDW